MHVHACCCVGLLGLRELSLERNALRSLAPLSALSGLQVLRAAHNQLASCAGVEVRARVLAAHAVACLLCVRIQWPPTHATRARMLQRTHPHRVSLACSSSTCVATPCAAWRRLHRCGRCRCWQCCL